MHNKEERYIMGHRQEVDILSFHESQIESDVLKEFYDSQKKPQTEEEIKLDSEKEAERQKNL